LGTGSVLGQSVSRLRESVLEVRPEPASWSPPRRVEFVCYCIVAMAIHAGIAIPALVARLVTDITLGHSFFQAVKPKKRQDLY
jgi:hypothetical protein